MHAALWATKFCDITGNNTDLLENPQKNRAKLSQMWHDWFRKRIAENMPYDEIVHGVLCATSRDGLSPEEYVKAVKEQEEAEDKGWTNAYADRDTLDLFWRRQQKVTPDPVGREDRRRVPGRPRRMRRVPQAPVRPLDPGRLPRLCQHLRVR